MPHFWVGVPSFSPWEDKKREISGVPVAQAHIKTTGQERGRQRGKKDVCDKKNQKIFLFCELMSLQK